MEKYILDLIDADIEHLAAMAMVNQTLRSHASARTYLKKLNKAQDIRAQFINAMKKVKK